MCVNFVPNFVSTYCISFIQCVDCIRKYCFTIRYSFKMQNCTSYITIIREKERSDCLNLTILSKILASRIRSRETAIYRSNVILSLRRNRLIHQRITSSSTQ